MTKQCEPGGPGRPWPPKGMAAPASTGRCLEGVHSRVAGPDFSKDGRNVDFLIYKYQKLNIFEILGLNLMRLEVRWFYPRERWGRPGRDMRGLLGTSFLVWARYRAVCRVWACHGAILSWFAPKAQLIWTPLCNDELGFLCVLPSAFWNRSHLAWLLVQPGPGSGPKPTLSSVSTPTPQHAIFFGLKCLTPSGLLSCPWHQVQLWPLLPPLDLSPFFYFVSPGSQAWLDFSVLPGSRATFLSPSLQGKSPAPTVEPAFCQDFSWPWTCGLFTARVLMTEGGGQWYTCTHFSSLLEGEAL